MTIRYDHKTQGLLVEVPEGELETIAADIRGRAGGSDLPENDIRHVTYALPVSEEAGRRRAIGWLILMLLLWPSILAVMLSGLYQIGRWIVEWAC